MLLELKVSNFAIIESLSLSFKKGFNILSGETGAGKSVLLKSLALLMGEKATSDIVRSGKDQALVEGSFDLSHRKDLIKILESQGISVFDDLMIVRRLISKEGKSRVYINENLCTLNTLQNIVSPLIELTSERAPLVEMTSQHENKNLMSKDYHLELLDYFSGAIELRTQYGKNYHTYFECEEKIQGLMEKSQNTAQRLDFLKYQRDEIASLKLQPGSEEKIESDYNKIKNASQLSEFIQNTEQVLFGDEDSVLVKLHKLIQKSNDYAKYDEQLKKNFEALIQAKTLIEETVYDLRTYSKDIDSDKKNSIEETISKLRHLQRKYGQSSEEILTALVKIEEEIYQLENSENVLNDLKQKKKEIELVLLKQSQDLHKKRISGSEKLEKLVMLELKDLNMKDTQFQIALRVLDSYCPTGRDEAEFVMRSSNKEEFRSISKYASGGELSRILLSLKKVIGHAELPRTYLFDEVDTGVSGPTAEKVGKKLKSIAQGQQVICVTHLPQVAAFGDVHFLIEKDIGKRGTQMKISELSTELRIREIARLISGEKISKTSIDHAKSLLQSGV